MTVQPSTRNLLTNLVRAVSLLLTPPAVPRTLISRRLAADPRCHNGYLRFIPSQNAWATQQGNWILRFVAYAGQARPWVFELRRATNLNDLVACVGPHASLTSAIAVAHRLLSLTTICGRDGVVAHDLRDTFSTDLAFLGDPGHIIALAEGGFAAADPVAGDLHSVLVQYAEDELLHAVSDPALPPHYGPIPTRPIRI